MVLAAGIGWAGLPGLAHAQTVIYVTTRNDCASCGSLRDAIIQANALPASQAVTIDLSPVGFGTVSRTSGLPTIRRPILMTGPGAGTLFVGASLDLQPGPNTTSTFSAFTFGPVQLSVGNGTLIIAPGSSGMFDRTRLLTVGMGLGDPSPTGRIVINGTQQVDSMFGRGEFVIGDVADVTVQRGSIENRLVSLQSFDSIIRKTGSQSLTFNLGSGGQLGPSGRIFIDQGSVEVIDGELRSAFIITSELHLRATTGQQLVLSQFNGTGVVHKFGAGETFLGNPGTSDNFFGRMVVHEGVLAGWTSTLTGDILNNATVRFVQDYQIGTAGNFDGTYAFNMTGTGSLVKTGRGALILTGLNTYSGGTHVQEGALVGSTASVQGAIVNDGEVRFDQSFAGVYAGSMSGAGSLVKSGTGTVTLTGANTYTGATIVNGGMLRAGAPGALGSGGAIVHGTLALNGFDAAVAGLGGGGEVALGGAHLSVGWNGSDSTFSGSITGFGSLTKTGAGTLTLLGANSYTGGTSISGGILQIAGDASLGTSSAELRFDGGALRLAGAFSTARPLVLAAAGTIDTNGFDAALSGSLSGAGSFTKSGDGTLWLTGPVSHAGGTFVLRGTLAGHTNSLLGRIDNHALITFDQNFDGAFSGTITGTGGVRKIGAGVLTFTGDQRYAGLSDIAAGGLVLGGALSGGLAIREGAFFRPIAPAAVGGDLMLFHGSTYQVPLNTAMQAYPLRVSGVAAIDGAVLNLQMPSGAAAAPAVSRLSTTLLLTAAEIQGGFSAVTGADGFDAFLRVRNRELWLTLLRRSLDFVPFASSPQGAAVAAALTTASPGDGDFAMVLRELRALETDDEIAVALEAMAGREHATATGVSLLHGEMVSDLLALRFDGRPGPWVRPFGSRMTLAPRVDATSPSADLLGTIAGVDWRFGSRGMAGVAAGRSNEDVDGQGDNRAEIRNYHGAAYAELNAGRYFVDAAALFSTQRRRTERRLSFTARLDGDTLFGGVDRIAAADYRALQTVVLMDVGRSFDAGGLTLSAAAGLQLARLSRRAFTEAGADSLNLSASRQTADNPSARLRIHGGWRFSRHEMTFAARYSRGIGARALTVPVSLAGAPFQISTFEFPRHTFAGQAGIRMAAGPVTFAVDYSLIWALDQRQHLVSVGIGR